MTHFSKLLVGAAGVSMAAMSASAGAQGYYPPPPAPTYNQGYNQQGGVIGQVLNQVLGGGRYGAYGQGNDRMAVDQCARAVEARVSSDNRRGVYGAWNQNGNQGYGNPGYGNQGYGNQGYNQGQYYGQAQVVGVTGVQRTGNGVKVTGLIDTRMGRNQGAYGQYNNPYGQNPGYGNQAYPGQSYGQQAIDPRYAELRFSCRVDVRGRVSDLDIRRNRRG